MPRPRRCRRVGFHPDFRYFRPGGRAKGEIVLKIEELESLRLKDLLQLDQIEAAKLMDISQPTFHRILKEARRKVAEALVDGKAIRVSGGDYRFRNLCYDCRSEWGAPLERCPICGGISVSSVAREGGRGPPHRKV